MYTATIFIPSSSVILYSNTQCDWYSKQYFSRDHPWHKHHYSWSASGSFLFHTGHPSECFGMWAARLLMCIFLQGILFCVDTYFGHAAVRVVGPLRMLIVTATEGSMHTTSCSCAGITGNTVIFLTFAASIFFMFMQWNWEWHFHYVLLYWLLDAV